MSATNLCLGCEERVPGKHQCLVGMLTPGVMGGWYCSCEKRKCAKKIKRYRQQNAEASRFFF